MRFRQTFTRFQIERGNRRLTKLANYLAELDADRVAKGLPPYKQAAFIHPCMTPACALGNYPSVNPRWRLYHGAPALVRFSSGSSGLDASIEFSLTPTQQHRLFSVYGCGMAGTGKEAAAYIRRFVRNRKRSLARLA